MIEEGVVAGFLTCMDKLLDHQDFVASDILGRRVRRAADAKPGYFLCLSGVRKVSTVFVFLAKLDQRPP